MSRDEEEPLGQIARAGREKMHMQIWELALLISVDQDVIKQFEAQSIPLEKRIYIQLVMYLRLSPVFLVRAFSQFDKTPEQQAKTNQFLALHRAMHTDPDKSFCDMLDMIAELPPEKQSALEEMFGILTEFSRQRDEYKERKD